MKIKLPNTYSIIFGLIGLTAGLTWIMPGGKYETTRVAGMTRVDPESFHFVDANPQGIADILMAPLNGFVDAALIIGFVLIVGGCFYVLQHTEAIDAAILSLAKKHRSSRFLQLFLIPIFMTLFSIAGAVFGMSEEVIPFVMLFIPMALALGYDTVTGVAIPFIGAGTGFAAAYINPFTLGIAQGIAELPPLSGMGYRLVCWAAVTLTAIIFVMVYAGKIRRRPERSISFKLDNERKKDLKIDQLDQFGGIKKQHKLVLVLFGLALIILVVGVLSFQWYITEISALFLLTAIVVGLAGRLTIDKISESFIKGAGELVGTALVIALARGILVIARDGQIIDTLLFYLSGIVGELHPILSAQSMFLVQTLLNFFVPSGSGQAALTMPIMAPLSDLIGVTRQTAVLAFQFGDGFSNMIIPTSGVTMGVLALAGIPWEKWVRWILPLEGIFFLLALILLIFPVLFTWT